MIQFIGYKNFAKGLPQPFADNSYILAHDTVSNTWRAVYPDGLLGRKLAQAPQTSNYFKRNIQEGTWLVYKDTPRLIRGVTNKREIAKRINNAHEESNGTDAHSIKKSS